MLHMRKQVLREVPSSPWPNQARGPSLTPSPCANHYALLPFSPEPPPFGILSCFPTAAAAPARIHSLARQSTTSQAGGGPPSRQFWKLWTSTPSKPRSRNLNKDTQNVTNSQMCGQSGCWICILGTVSLCPVCWLKSPHSDPLTHERSRDNHWDRECDTSADLADRTERNSPGGLRTCPFQEAPSSAAQTPSLYLGALVSPHRHARFYPVGRPVSRTPAVSCSHGRGGWALTTPSP